MEKKHTKAITSDRGLCLTAPRNAFSFCDTETNEMFTFANDLT